MKLLTEIDIRPTESPIGLSDRIMMLGSCFTDSIGAKMRAGGFDVSINPFGPLYNPASILSALRRLDSGEPFSSGDCVEMGAGAGLVCSFSHHTSFARKTAGEFLQNANASLADAAAFWRESTCLLVTLGTAFLWKRVGDGTVVSNCLKRPACEFERALMEPGEVRKAAEEILDIAGGRKVIFTVSPIRHLGQGFHENTLSKATLHLGTDGLGWYFPSYELMMDELRDYRFYSDTDLCHPSELAVSIIWEKFKQAAVVPAELEAIAGNEKNSLRAGHRKILS